MSNLINHAKRELEIIGEEPETVDGYLKMIEIFDNMGHSGGSASVFIPTLQRLMSFQNLAPITDNPDEWMHVADEKDGTPLLQCTRNSALFSTDGGKTYTSVDEPRETRGTVHTSAPHQE